MAISTTAPLAPEVIAMQSLQSLLARGRVLGLGFGLMLSASCHADGAAIAKAGAGAGPACQTCHGTAGEGVAQASFPRLASLGAPYLQRQLAAFADGTRVSDVMMPIAKALSVADRAEVAAYYAALPAPAAPTAAPLAASASPRRRRRPRRPGLSWPRAAVGPTRCQRASNVTAREDAAWVRTSRPWPGKARPISPTN